MTSSLEVNNLNKTLDNKTRARNKSMNCDDLLRERNQEKPIKRPSQ